MQRRTNAFCGHLLAVIAMCAFPLMQIWPQEAVLTPSAIKIYLVYPLTSYASLEFAWLEVVKCGAPNEPCNQLVATIPFRHVKISGRLEPKIEAVGMLKILYRRSADTAWIIGSQMPQNHWFPKVELCAQSVEKAQCKIVITKNNEQKSLNIQVLENK